MEPFEDITVVTEDGIKIRCYLIQKKDSETYADARGTIILFHGNSADRGDLLEPFASQWWNEYNVLLAEYRGYGLSEGTPTEKRCPVVDYVRHHPLLSVLPIILYGHSLGGAVAIHVASENSDKIDALILENTFASLAAVVRDIPIVGWPLSVFCPDKWNSVEKISRIPQDIPILLLGGMKDEVLKLHHMKSLWRAVKKRNATKSLQNSSQTGGEEKEAGDLYAVQDQFIIFPDGLHSTTHEESGYWTVTFGFLDSVQNWRSIQK
ncbi:Protein bem46 [Psilocybe cubensis]|uniref:Protein bem46 n=1 Tax=Psilocybe cubensis TaxID=181762 RepID=A0ACB8GZR9_PSICU|nr:Protein bem46 [Psilocybe cubensis]KAH9481081.1 Protein bem46 [Psilocybe cubensis]